MQPRVIFFDVGQTLVTGAPRSSRRLLSARLHLSEKETKQAGKLIMTHPATEPASLAEALAERLPGKDPLAILKAVEGLWQEQLKAAREVEGAVTLLRFLKDQGLGLGIISNIWHPFYESLYRNHPDMMELLDYQVLSYRTGCKKPSIQLFQEAIRASGEPAQSCWMVGDSYELDMAPAAKAGMGTLWVLCRPEAEKGLLAQILRGEKAPPGWVVEDLNEALNYFRKTSERS